MKINILALIIFLCTSHLTYSQNNPLEIEKFKKELSAKDSVIKSHKEQIANLKNMPSDEIQKHREYIQQLDEKFWNRFAILSIVMPILISLLVWYFGAERKKILDGIKEEFKSKTNILKEEFESRMKIMQESYENSLKNIESETIRKANEKINEIVIPKNVIEKANNLTNDVENIILKEQERIESSQEELIKKLENNIEIAKKELIARGFDDIDVLKKEFEGQLDLKSRIDELEKKLPLFELKTDGNKNNSQGVKIPKLEDLILAMEKSGLNKKY